MEQQGRGVSDGFNDVCIQNTGGNRNVEERLNVQRMSGLDTSIIPRLFMILPF